MRILHTSDLHIGKKLMGRERYEEYRAVFGELAEISEREQVDLILIAGDIFDTYTPSAEAEEIFYSGLKLLSYIAAVLVISGNHDDYVRLTAASALAEELNAYIVGNNLSPVKCGNRGKTYPKESDSGWVVFANEKGEEVYINLLPYPNEARFKTGRTDESYVDKMKGWLNYGERGNNRNLPSILLSHIFVYGGKVSDSEREIDLGGARIVPLEILPSCDYIALGHLHRRQHLSKNVYYCGATMQFSFDESGAKKSVNFFEITESGVQNFKQIELTKTKNLIRLQANDVKTGIKLLKDNPDCYVELTLNLGAPLTPAENSELHLQENLVSLKAEIKTEQALFERASNKNKSSSQLFSEYYKSRYGEDITQDLLALFLSLTEEE